VQSLDNIDENDRSSQHGQDSTRAFDVNDLISRDKQNCTTAVVLYDSSTAPTDSTMDENGTIINSQNDPSFSPEANVWRNTATNSAGQINHATGPGTKVAEKEANNQGKKQENKEESTFAFPQKQQLARAVIKGNIADSAARQRNRVIGSDTMVSENEAHGEGTSQENSASTCVVL
jgi:hypothetical protein